MGLGPREFYEMEFSDFLLARDGLSKRLKYEESLVRKQTFIIAQTLGQKLRALEKAWPDPYKPVKVKKMVTYQGVVMTEHQMQILKQLERERKING